MEWFMAPEYWLARRSSSGRRGRLSDRLPRPRAVQALIMNTGCFPFHGMWRGVHPGAPSLFHTTPTGSSRRLLDRGGAVGGNRRRRGRLGAAVGGDDDVAGLWMPYLSIVNVGQSGTRSAGSPCCWEAGFSLYSWATTRPRRRCRCSVLARWLLFRVEFGAGLIKLRGDLLARSDMPVLPPRNSRCRGR